MGWALSLVATWLLLAAGIALLIGRSIHQADVTAAADEARAPASDVLDGIQAAPAQRCGDADDAQPLPSASLPAIPGTSTGPQAPGRRHLRVAGTGGAASLDEGNGVPALRSDTRTRHPARRPSAS